MIFEVYRNDSFKRSRFLVYFGEKSLKTRKTLLRTTILALLAVSLALPLGTISASAKEEQVQATWSTEGNWTYIQNDIITIVFPAGGEKPMFLWWYTDDPDNINVVKYKGLIEYATFEQPYFLWRWQVEPLMIRERIRAAYYDPGRHRLQEMLQILWKIGNATGLHSPYLPFGACRWELSNPVNVTKGDVKYLSFNFTLVDVPDGMPNLQFAENNIILRCRFYYTPATEDVHGLYSYSVEAGELKMDLVVKHWEWNMDKLEPFLQLLRDAGFDIPEREPRLALWINLASINLTKLAVAEQEATTLGDTSYVEGSSKAQNMYVEGQQVTVMHNETAAGTDEHPLRNRLRERFKFRFERGNATLAGFFKYVPQAVVTDGVTYNTTDVTASYISAGAHMRVFLGYPYFGNNTLEHDPSIGLEVIPALITGPVLITLLVATAVIAAAIVVIRWRKRVVNIVGVH